MSFLSTVEKGINVAAPQLVGADYNQASNSFWMFNGPGGLDYKFSYTGHQSSLKAFQKCSPLTSIICKKAQAFINGKTLIVNRKGKGKEKEATGEIASKIKKLMAEPNPLQSQKEYEAQQYIYTQLFGYCIVLPLKPVGFPIHDATALWNIPPSMLDIEETEKNWLLAKEKADVIKSIIINFKGERTTIPVKDVYIVKDITPSFKSAIFPESRVCSLEMEINNIIGAYESRNVLINYRGALGAISPQAKDVAGPVPLKEEDKKELQSDFSRYGLKNSQWKFIISNAAIKWSQIGIPTKDLMLFEEIEDDIMRICDRYNFPYPLMASNRTNSLGGNNIGESKVLLYQDAIIPEAEDICEQWNKLFETSAYNIIIQKDFSHVQVLQADKVKEAQWRNTLNDAKKKEFDAGLITLNDWLIALGEEPLPEDLGNVRATDVKNSNIPLAVTMGVGGVQGLVTVITAQGMSVEARQATLEIVFGLAPADAQRMAQDGTNNTNGNANQSGGNNQ